MKRNKDSGDNPDFFAESDEFSEDPESREYVRQWTTKYDEQERIPSEVSYFYIKFRSQKYNHSGKRHEFEDVFEDSEIGDISIKNKFF